ncbi:MAG: 4Fe-4S dicluster domain-containing protein [Thermodesulfobacteriota bacterium]
MMRKSFINLGRKPKLPYTVLPQGTAGSPKEVPLPDKVVLYCGGPQRNGRGLLLARGNEVRTGQKMLFGTEEDASLVSTVTGKIADISTRKGYLGRTFAAVTIDVSPVEEPDPEFARILKQGAPEEVLRFLGALPGMTPFRWLARREPALKTLVIMGMDQDLLLQTNAYLLESHMNDVGAGIEALKKMAGIERIVLAVPPRLVPEAERTGADVLVVKPVYPNAHPSLILNRVLGRPVPPGRPSHEEGVGILGVGAVVAFQNALQEGKVPVTRTLTVVNKDLTGFPAKVRVGTPVQKVLEALGISTAHGDRVILGGPMTGEAAYSEDVPVLFDTQGILVQDGNQIEPVSDTHCINCGECVRACPARIPVNMLIRFLENGLYQEAADEYDLPYCIECGLCSYVCTARIPLFQYIMLGKSELARTKSAEVSHD